MASCWLMAAREHIGAEREAKGRERQDRSNGESESESEGEGEDEGEEYWIARTFAGLSFEALRRDFAGSV